MKKRNFFLLVVKCSVYKNTLKDDRFLKKKFKNRSNNADISNVNKSEKLLAQKPKI